jgi:hypothetical protein
VIAEVCRDSRPTSSLSTRFRLQQATRFRAVTGNEGEILYEIKTGRTGAVPALLRVRTMPRSITRLLCLCSPWMATPNCQHRPSLLNNNWRSAAPEPEISAEH